jgi:hypothetical protein
MDTSRFKRSTADVPCIAVFLHRVNSINLHTGIVYKDAKGTFRRLHLGWQRQLLADQKCRPNIDCAVPVFDSVDLVDEQFIAAFCGRIARSLPNRRIPYNLKIDNEVRFNLAGDIEVGRSFTGLSCATFVVAIFRSTGNPLIDTNGWPAASAQDEAIQRNFVNALEGSDNPDWKAQADAIRPEIGGPRIAPEEVAGACLEDSYPVAHPKCEAAGRFIVAAIDAAHTQPPSPHSPTPPPA